MQRVLGSATEMIHLIYSYCIIGAVFAGASMMVKFEHQNRGLTMLAAVCVGVFWPAIAATMLFSWRDV